VPPLPQRCILLAHEEASLPSSLLPLPWPSPLQSLLPSPLPLPLSSAIALPLPLPIAVAVAIGHCRCGRCQTLPPPSLSRFCQSSLLRLPLLLAIAFSVTIGYRSCHLHWPSPLLLLLAISESCCLGMARIVFKQCKHRMLTLFYFVWTVGSALIKAG
jgi:hypothetical protein